MVELCWVLQLRHCTLITSDQWLLTTLSTVQNPFFHISIGVEHRQFFHYQMSGVTYQFSPSLWVCCSICGVHKVCASCLSAPERPGSVCTLFLRS